MQKLGKNMHMELENLRINSLLPSIFLDVVMLGFEMEHQICTKLQNCIKLFQR